ncbi:MAG: hypothetical protein HUU01_13540 [Saprospiraceae bacterium]|nr:hypothetical protein [Saprospiraceae bacterium]
MKSIVHHPAPNIVPGVNLTAERFAAIYAWIASIASDTAFSTRRPFQYGLSIPFDGKPALNLKKNGATLVLARCVGITPAGSIIGLFEDVHPPMTLELEEQELRPQERYAVMIEADSGTRYAFGPESEDLPLRPQFTRTGYSLQVQPVSQQMAFQSDAFCIGVLISEFGKWQLADYVPPCTQLGASPRLRERYQEYTAEMEELLRLFPQIILNTDAYHEKSMVELRELAMQLGSFMSFHRYRYRHLGPGSNPFELFEFWVAFARQTSFLLQCLKDRSGFYNLLNENTRQRNGVYFTAQSWDAAIQALANLAYDHNDVSTAIELTDRFLEMVSPIFKALGYGVEQVKNRTSWEEEKRKDYTTW